MQISDLIHGSRWLSGRTIRIAVLVGLIVHSAGTAGATATIYKWPLGTGTTPYLSPDVMNTSFGPRINYDKWDFHDGIDLPAKCGTPIHPVAGGTVVLADIKNSSWSSRHVVIKVNDSTRGDVYVIYLHLSKIDNSVLTKLGTNQPLSDPELIGLVGEDGNASYCHLHIEFRRFDPQDPTHVPPQANSLHPLNFLPYNDSPTPNFTAPTGARFNRGSSGQMAARLVFDAGSKLEGDLARVEVDLKSGATTLATRQVNFDDKATINEGNGDDLEFVNDIAVEGYQTSDMGLVNRNDLKYGVVVRNLPDNCDALVARVYDLGNHMATSATVQVPSQKAVEQSLDFENGLATPPGWLALTSSGTSVANAMFAHGGTHSLVAIDDSALAVSQKAAIELGLGGNRFEWLAEGWIYPRALELPDEADQVYLLYFLDAGGVNPSVSARLRRTGGAILAGIVAKQSNGKIPTDNSTEDIKPGVGAEGWSKWTLRLLRVATRETAAVLSLNGMERARLSWDSTGNELLKVRVGVGQSFSGVKATLYVDDVLITEKTL